jgi:predicted lactoylglutathione lyase
MNLEEHIVTLPTDDLERAYAFYKALGLQLARNPDSDVLPEPLEFRLTSASVLMFAPRDGFAFAAASNEVAPHGTSECVQSMVMGSKSEVDALIEKARSAGAAIVTEPSQQFMGYASVFKDLDGHLWVVVCVRQG